MKEEIVKKYHHAKSKNAHMFHRYMSWDHCYINFGKASPDVEALTLHLTSYLASWGMYRGSSFLLEFDYKIHKEIVKLVLGHKQNLRGLKVGNLEKRVDEIVTLHNDICGYYDGTLMTYSKNWKSKKVRTSEILSSKIMLGTLACVPAYDRFFKIGLKLSNISQSFSKKSISGDFLEFAIGNQSKISHLRKQLNYPDMKILDMYFWQLGYDAKDPSIE